MVTLQWIVVANDAACFRAILVRQDWPMSQVAQLGEHLLYIQYVGIYIRPLGQAQNRHQLTDENDMWWMTMLPTFCCRFMTTRWPLYPPTRRRHTLYYIFVNSSSTRRRQWRSIWSQALQRQLPSIIAISVSWVAGRCFDWPPETQFMLGFYVTMEKNKNF